MRLINADALRDYMATRELCIDGVPVVDPDFTNFLNGCVAFLDAAPTVCCAECAHYLPWSDKKSGECAQRHMESEHYPTPTFGCVDFERRAS